MAVANSDENSVALYSAAKSGGRGYSRKRVGKYKNRAKLNYAHAVAFLGGEQRMAVLGEYSDALCIIEFDNTDAGRYRGRLVQFISGADSGLCQPSDVAVHPTGQWLAVANRVAAGISCYARDGADGRLTARPVQVLSGDDLEALGLAAPHGLDFSADGRYLFTVHKKYAGGDGGGQSALCVFACLAEPRAGFCEAPALIHWSGEAALHCVACHPEHDILGVTNSLGDVDFFRWGRASVALEKFHSIRVFRVGEGVKGIAFTPDGRSVALTSELDEVLIFDLDKVFGR